MSELKLEGFAAVGVTQHLVTKANPEDRFLAHQPANRLVRIIERRRIAGSIREKDAVGIEL